MHNKDYTRMKIEVRKACMRMIGVLRNEIKCHEMFVGRTTEISALKEAIKQVKMEYIEILRGYSL